LPIIPGGGLGRPDLLSPSEHAGVFRASSWHRRPDRTKGSRTATTSTSSRCRSSRSSRSSWSAQINNWSGRARTSRGTAPTSPPIWKGPLPSRCGETRSRRPGRRPTYFRGRQARPAIGPGRSTSCRSGSA